VRSILWKTMSRQREGKPVLIKSVFCTPTAGYIYIEAIEEPLAREAIAGLSGIYYSTLKRVPLAEMTTLLTFTVRAKPVKEGQWCRMRRGPLKGDLVKVRHTLPPPPPPPFSLSWTALRSSASWRAKTEGPGRSSKPSLALTTTIQTKAKPPTPPRALCRECLSPRTRRPRGSMWRDAEASTASGSTSGTTISTSEGSSSKRCATRLSSLDPPLR
jgi:hypothetical protein